MSVCKKLRVIKRDGRLEDVQFDKITTRIEKLCEGLSTSHINVTLLTQSVIENLIDKISVSELDDIAAMKAAMRSLDHPDYNILAGRLCVSNIQKTTEKTFHGAMKVLWEEGILNEDTWKFIDTNKDILNDAIIYDNDMNLEYFGIQTLKKSYLEKVHGKIIETPQYMYMRVACGVNYKHSVEEAIDMYRMLSSGVYIHSSPTLFNSGTVRPQLASCFLIDLKDDSIEGIFDTYKVTALISKYAGGVGLNIHKVRSNKSHIKGTNGESQGIVPWLKIFNDTALAVNQAGRRKGSFAAYLEPHHADFMEFLDIRKPEKPDNRSAKDLFTAVWLSDLFMERVKNNQMWTFFDPNTNEDTKKLENTYDDFEDKAYTRLYEKLEASGVGKSQMKAQEVWMGILLSQLKTGTPYLLNKDVVNRTSNQKNLGVIKSSNLCSEIVEYTAPDETAVCTLASINLSKFVDVENGTMYYNKIAEVASKAVVNLNKTIDYGFYPTECSRRSHMRHRPIGLGVSGLQDVFFILKIPFTSDKAKKINSRIFEAIYYGTVSMSCELAEKYGPYETFHGSPASKGILNYDMWDTEPDAELGFNWKELKNKIMKVGLRNSLHVALMPTASSASILGVTECFEPIKSNIFTRQVLSGEFILVNKYLIRDLIHDGLWSDKIVNEILSNHGSIQDVKGIPDKLKEVYKTAYELKMRDIIDMAADRNPWVDQSQSLNLFVNKIKDMNKLNSMYFYAYKKKLKTLVYYLRIKPQGSDIKFSVKKTEEDECLSCQA